MERFPLIWPVGHRRTSMPETNTAFRDIGARDEMDALLNELRLLKATDAVISCNIPLKGDKSRDWNAAIRSNADKGVAVYFRMEERGQVVACDAWDSFAHNLRALTKTIEAIRGLRHWKAT